MTLCPSDEQLAGLLADALTTAERDAVVGHVEGCASCAERLARLTGTLETETSLRAEHPLQGSEAEDEMMRRLKQKPQWLVPTLQLHGSRPAGDLPYARTPTVVGSEPPTVPGYEILGEVGRGGMGVVYQARQLGLDRTVALKMVLTGIHTGPKELARFRAEAAAIARLQHPNIVQIFDVGEAAGRPYFVLEFVAGGSLAQYLQGTPQPVRPAAQLVETLARAVHTAHVSGVIHRDLKPANILLDGSGARGEVAGAACSLTPDSSTPKLSFLTPKITDFGVAKCAGGDDEAPDAHAPTVTGELM